MPPEVAGTQIGHHAVRQRPVPQNRPPIPTPKGVPADPTTTSTLRFAETGDAEPRAASTMTSVTAVAADAALAVTYTFPSVV